MQNLLRNNLAFARHRPGTGLCRSLYLSAAQNGGYNSLARRVLQASARPKSTTALQWAGIGAGTVAAVGLHLALQPKLHCEREVRGIIATTDALTMPL